MAGEKIKNTGTGEVLKPLCFIPSVIVMTVIFIFSSADGEMSSSQSTLITGIIIKLYSALPWINLDFEEEAIYIAGCEYYIRKIAHFLEYALLGITLIYPLKVYKLKGMKLILIAEAICIVYAISDEIHQIFSNGRTPMISDVCIDSFGALCGIILILFVCYLYNLIKSR